MSAVAGAGTVTAKYNDYDDDDHGSVPLITTYDAFRFIFDWHRLKVYYPEDYGNPESKFLDKIVNVKDEHYYIVTSIDSTNYNNNYLIKSVLSD